MSDSLPANCFTMPVTVTEAEIDALGHVSNVVVVRWISRVSWEHSRALGYDMPDYRRLGGVFVVRRHEIDYRASAVLDDELLCHTWPSGLAKATAERRHRIVRVSDGAVVAEGVNVWAYVDMETGRPTRMPGELREAFDPAKFV